MKRIYLDYAASTPIDKRVIAKMKPYFAKHFANAISVHTEGRITAMAISESRKLIAELMIVTAGEIIFTSNATEANNLAIFGTIETYKKLNPDKPVHVITSSFEHHSVSNSAKKLESWGVKVTYLPVGEDGIVKAKDVETALTEDTALVSVMYAQNEIGTIQPLKEIGRVIRNFRKVRPSKGRSDLPFPLFHSDCAQAPAYLSFNPDSLGLDLASFTAQKFYGPKGVGFLVKRNRVEIAPQVLGGGQEFGYRSGTPNTPLIVGMAEALAIADKLREKEAERLFEIRSYFAKRVSEIEGAIINGSLESRLPGNLNISFMGVPALRSLGVEGEQMVIELDARGVAASTGSACLSLSDERVSEVVLAITGDSERAKNAVRFSMGRGTKKRDIDYVIKCIKEVVEKQKKITI